MIRIIPEVRTLPQDKAEARDAIKDAARERILALCPEWKQTNLLSRGMELVLRVVGGGAALTDAEKAEITEAMTLWAQIKAIRTASDTAEAAVNTAATPAAVWRVIF